MFCICLTNRNKRGNHASPTDRQKMSSHATENEFSGITFVVDDTVEKGGIYGSDPERMSDPTKGHTLKEAWLTVGGEGSTIEAMSPAPKGTVVVFTKHNLFVKAVHAAFFWPSPINSIT